MADVSFAVPPDNRAASFSGCKSLQLILNTPTKEKIAFLVLHKGTAYISYNHAVVLKNNNKINLDSLDSLLTETAFYTIIYPNVCLAWCHRSYYRYVFFKS